MQEYVTLRKEVLGLPEIHFSDLFVPLVPGIDRTYTYEVVAVIAVHHVSQFVGDGEYII